MDQDPNLESPEAGQDLVHIGDQDPALARDLDHALQVLNTQRKAKHQEQQVS